MKIRYMSFMSHSYSTKNKLEAAILEYLILADRAVFEKSYLEEFKANMITAVGNLNLHYPRCRPIEASWQLSNGHYNNKHDYYLELSGCSNSGIYKLIEAEDLK